MKDQKTMQRDAATGPVSDTARKRINFPAFLFLLVTAVFVLYVTVIIRTPTLKSAVQLIPSRSFFERTNIRQMLLNVALFVPMGYFLSNLFRGKRLVPLIISVGASVCVELIQYVTCRGTTDVNDLITNTLGAVLGIGLFCVFGNRKLLCFLLLASEAAGGVIAVAFTDAYSTDAKMLTQFYFTISSVQRLGGSVQLEGECFLYHQATPDYQLLLTDEAGSYEAETAVQGNTFVASAEAENDREYEVKIRFWGRAPITTGIWLTGTSIKYVPGSPAPEGVKVDGVLKAYNEKYDTYVYQNGDCLTWLVGWDINGDTEIIYHIHTDETDKLPENRVKYGYDNRSFRVGTKKERKMMGKYRVFSDIIPTKYHATAAIVGYKTDGRITWLDGFRVE